MENRSIAQCSHPRVFWRRYLFRAVTLCTHCGAWRTDADAADSKPWREPTDDVVTDLVIAPVVHDGPRIPLSIQ